MDKMFVVCKWKMFSFALQIIKNYLLIDKTVWLPAAGLHKTAHPLQPVALANTPSREVPVPAAVLAVKSPRTRASGCETEA